MLTFLRSAALGLAAVLFFSLGAHAAPFEAKSFQQAQAAGKPILIDVFASWCPTCKRQQPTLERLQKEKPNLIIYRVDYDTDKDVLRRFKVQKQATLIMFKGTNEVGRLIYDADPGNIAALVNKGY